MNVENFEFEKNNCYYVSRCDKMPIYLDHKTMHFLSKLDVVEISITEHRRSYSGFDTNLMIDDIMDEYVSAVKLSKTTAVEKKDYNSTEVINSISVNDFFIKSVNSNVANFDKTIRFILQNNNNLKQIVFVVDMSDCTRGDDDGYIVDRKTIVFIKNNNNGVNVVLKTYRKYSGYAFRHMYLRKNINNEEYKGEYDDEECNEEFQENKEFQDSIDDDVYEYCLDDYSDYFSYTSNEDGYDAYADYVSNYEYDDDKSDIEIAETHNSIFHFNNEKIKSSVKMK